MSRNQHLLPFHYKQPDVSHLVSQLRIRIAPKMRKFRGFENDPEGRLKRLRQTVTALFKYERIELNYPRADEARGYAERLISEAIRHGDLHKHTMDTANYWLEEKQLVHKLFKVLVPRFENYEVAYTSLYKAPLNIKESLKGRSVLELKGNPFPPLIFDSSRNKNLIHNVLLEEARKEYRKQQRAEIAEQVSQSERQKTQPEEDKEREKTLLKAAEDVTEGEQLLKSVESDASYPESEKVSDTGNESPLVTNV